jgi:hypothetical protein
MLVLSLGALAVLGVGALGISLLFRSGSGTSGKRNTPTVIEKPAGDTRRDAATEHQVPGGRVSEKKVMSRVTD